MTMKRRGALMVALGLALTGGLFGFAATPAQALSISGTYTDIAFGTAGTEPNAGFGLNQGLVGAIGAPLTGTGFPNGLATNFWSTASAGISADPVGTRVDNASGLTLPASFSTNFFQTGHTSNVPSLSPPGGYLAVHWTAAFSNPGGNALFTLRADDHAFLYIDGHLFLDDGGVKAIIDPQAAPKVFTLAGNHTLDLFFADVQTTQAGIIFSCVGCEDPTSTVPEPATLVLFGTTLVGLGSMLRRRLNKSGKDVA